LLTFGWIGAPLRAIAYVTTVLTAVLSGHAPLPAASTPSPACPSRRRRYRPDAGDSDADREVGIQDILLD
jgi:hypothetical protein